MVNLQEKEKFVERLRLSTNYRASRKLYNAVFYASMWICGSMLFGAVLCFINAVNDDKNSKELFFASGVLFVVPVFLYALTFLFYEWSILLFDIGDALIHSAYVNHVTYLQTFKRTKDA